MARMDFMDVENIKNELSKNDAYTIKDWYENYVCGGAEFERMADALCDINEDEFLWQVADYISGELDEEEFVDIIKEEGWDYELTPKQEYEYEVRNGDYINFVNCTIQFKNEDKTEDVIIAVEVTADDLNEDDENEGGCQYAYSDEDIFFYADNVDEVSDLFNKDNGEDFYIVGFDSVE